MMSLLLLKRKWGQKNTELIKKESDLSLLQKEKLQNQTKSLLELLPESCMLNEANEFKEIFADALRNLLIQNVPEKVVKELFFLNFCFQFYRFTRSYLYLYFPFFKSKNNLCDLCNQRKNIEFRIRGAIICSKNGFTKIIHNKTIKYRRLFVCQNCGSYLFQWRRGNEWVTEKKDFFSLNIKTVFQDEIKKRI